jgi:hypothetical protein
VRHRLALSNKGFEFHQTVEAMRAAIAEPEIPDFIAAAAHRKFLGFRSYHGFAALGTRRPSEIALVEKTHWRCVL